MGSHLLHLQTTQTIASLRGELGLTMSFKPDPPPRVTHIFRVEYKHSPVAAIP